MTRVSFQNSTFTSEKMSVPFQFSQAFHTALVFSDSCQGVSYNYTSTFFKENISHWRKLQCIFELTDKVKSMYANIAFHLKAVIKSQFHFLDNQSVSSEALQEGFSKVRKKPTASDGESSYSKPNYHL